MPCALLPRPAAIPATCVPWPLRSRGVPPSTKSVPSTMRAASLRSGWSSAPPVVIEMPLSITPITTVGSPVSRSQAAKALTIGSDHWSASRVSFGVSAAWSTMSGSAYSTSSRSESWAATAVTSASAVTATRARRVAPGGRTTSAVSATSCTRLVASSGSRDASSRPALNFTITRRAKYSTDSPSQVPCTVSRPASGLGCCTIATPFGQRTCWTNLCRDADGRERNRPSARRWMAGRNAVCQRTDSRPRAVGVMARAPAAGAASLAASPGRRARGARRGGTGGRGG